MARDSSGKEAAQCLHGEEKRLRDEVGLYHSHLRGRWWLWANVLSLDAAAVAMVWQILLTECFRVPTGRATAVVLGCSVWLIYLWDHVLDTRNPAPVVSEPARKIFFRNRQQLMLRTAIVGTLVTLASACAYLNRVTLRFGLAGCLLVALYFCAVHLLPRHQRSRWPREAAVALLFTCGVYVPVWLQAGTERRLITFSSLPFFLLCWLNCCLVETAEWRSAGEALTDAPNLLAGWIADHARLSASIIFVTALSLVSLEHLPSSYLAAVLLSAIGLFVIARCELGDDAARLCFLADLALCAPLPVLVLRWLLRRLETGQ